MTISSSLSVALSGLSTSAEQLTVVSRNVARAGDEGATRKTANVITSESGGTRVASITRATNSALLEKVLGSTSDASAQKIIATSLDQLDQTVNDPELDGSPSGLIGKLQTALQSFSAAPQDVTVARAAVAAAKDLAQGLNDATKAVQNQRAQADAAMLSSVNNINDLLAQFKTVNDEVAAGTLHGADVTDSLDQRDQILKSLSQEIGIRTTADSSNSMSIYTDSGVTLFNGTPRAVSFQTTTAYSATVTGNPVYVDGVPITGSSGSMLARSGNLVGYATVRDNLANSYQSQLDEIARGLVETFAETDPNSPPTLPALPGLFTYAGAPAMPASGTLSSGIAATISVNPAVDSDVGGNAMSLRDGGMNGLPYVSNFTGSSAYTERLLNLVDAMSATRNFDPAALANTSGSLADYAASSAAWLQAQRKTATAASDYKTTLQQRSTDALSQETGVNIDEEMTNMLQFERAYQASSRLMNAIDNVFQTLLQSFNR